MSTAVVVPVMKNFKGFAELMESIDTPVLPLVIDNWTHNAGVGPAWNRGIVQAAEAGCEYAVIVNDDVVLPSGMIGRLTERLTGRRAIVSPTNVTGVCHPRGLNFWCFAIKPREFIQQYGLFDENFAPAYYEDDDMAYRVRLAGGVIETIADTAYHQVMGTQSMDSVPVVGYDVWDKNEKYYAEKWGGSGGNEKFRTPFNDPDKTIKDW